MATLWSGALRGAQGCALCSGYISQKERTHHSFLVMTFCFIVQWSQHMHCLTFPVLVLIVLLAGNFTAGRRYTFNIYECTENGHRQLEIQSGYSEELGECYH